MINSGYPILGQVYNLSERAPATKMSEEQIKELNAKLNRSTPPEPKDVVADNHPSNQYATLENNGSVIATVYKSGLMMTPSGVSVPNNLVKDGNGTSLADIRLKQMMELHGGVIKYAQDTIMKATSMTASTLFSAQLAGQS